MSNKKQVLEKILKKIKKREHSEFEIKNLLKRENISDNDAEEIMMLLKKNDLINDLRFTRAFVHDKFYLNKWGKEKIVSSLKQHKISDEIINDALKDIDINDYYETFKKLAINKLKGIKAEELYAKKIKVIKFLITKGLSYEDATKITDTIFNEQLD